jgi:hypothetical protein
MKKPIMESAREAPLSRLERLVELEATQTLESTRWLGQQFLQVATVLGIANLTAVGYATTNRQAGIFLLGSGITVLLLIVYRAAIKVAVPLFCRLIALEDFAKSMTNVPDDTTISIVILNVLGVDFLSRARDINGIEDRATKQVAMNKVEIDMFSHLFDGAGKGTLILGSAMIIQVAMIPILVNVFGWHFL